jgi:diaminohydroxyphosphoribosylaminopyrimidine deaminase/5-amino-6-(5-phosphoribosylamino)uracil reductase
VELLPGKDGKVAIADVLAHLGARELQSLLVEGGAEVHGAFVEAGLVDRVALFLAPRLLGGGTPIAAGRGRSVADALTLGPPRIRRIGADLLLEAQVI